MSAPYYADDAVTVHAGDCLDVLATLPDASVDAVCTDPPYGLEFMGKAWDSFGRDTGNGYQETPRWGGERERTDIADDPRGRTKAPNFYTAGAPFQRWCELWTAECLRVLKPGCVFRSGNLMHLQPGRFKDLVEENRRRDTALICHQALPYSGNDAAPAVCRGYFDAYGDEVTPLRMARVFGVIEEDQPPLKGVTA